MLLSGARRPPASARALGGAAPLILVLALAASRCGAEPASDAGAAEPPLPALDDEAAMTEPLSSVTAAEAAWGARARALDGTPDGVRAGLEAARLARVVALRAEGEPALERARAFLLAASSRRSVEGACEAALELARLEARDRGDPGEAFVVAYRAARRFGGPRDAACAAEARRITAVLDAFRADPARLYAIDADPDHGDPSVGLAERGGEPSAVGALPHGGAEALALWTGARALAGVAAQLTSVSTFGEVGSGSARVVLALDAVAVFEAEEVPAAGDLPRRLALSLAGATVGAGVPALAPVGAGGLSRVRTSGDDEGARVVLDLEPGAECRLYALPEPFRIVVDVSRPVEAAPARAVDLVVLDPGHGGDDYGARAFGLHEADLALDLALRVREHLARRAPGIRVVLTRESDTFVSLEQRAAMANAIDADAFVSIHLNAADEEVDRGGITTFVLDTTDDRAALRLAARENGTGTAAVTELQRILAGLFREDQLAGSRRLADRVHRSLLVGARTVLPRLHDRHVRSAMFYVLVGAVMPAILVEASFMTREDEARALRTEGYRDALARGIADGIVRYAAP